MCTAVLNQVLWMNVCLGESIFGFKQEGQICNGQLCGQTWCLAVLGRDCELVTDCKLSKAAKLFSTQLAHGFSRQHLGKEKKARHKGTLLQCAQMTNLVEPHLLDRCNDPQPCLCV